MPTVRRHEPWEQWEDGDFVEGFALLVRKERRIDRKGREYYDLELADSGRSIPGKIWPDSPALQNVFEEKQFVHFKGSAKEFRGQLQVNIDHCRPATESDREAGFDPNRLVPSTPENVDDLQQRLHRIYPESIRRPVLRRLAEATLERWGDDLAAHPAAKSIHHAYRGGLLEHVVIMAELAGRVCDQYPDVDRDTVLIGVLYHDLGKIYELGSMPDNDYTLEGQLVGHVSIGHRMLLECAADVEGLSPELRIHLEHLILSHQGRREYGSPVEPSTLEAMVLSWVDDLDSRLNQVRAARDAVGRSGSLEYNRAMGRTLYLDPPPES